MAALFGILILLAGVERVRRGKTGFCVITGFYAVLAGAILTAAGLLL